MIASVASRTAALPLASAVFVMLIPGLLSAPAVFAQWRPDQQPVARRPAAVTAPAPDVVGAFATLYHARGEPKVMLFWNVAFDDETGTVRQAVDVTRRNGSSNSTSLEKHTAGPAGDATLREADGQTNESVERVTGERLVNPAKAPTPFSPRNAAELETAFRETFRRAGVHLFDRTANIRFTHANRDRAGVDPKLIEADAVMDRADVLLEVIPIPDSAATLGTAFKATVTSVRDGVELGSFYIDARPALARPPGRYIATESGFEWFEPPVKASISDVGRALAFDVMRSLGSVLPAP